MEIVIECKCPICGNKQEVKKGEEPVCSVCLGPLVAIKARGIKK